MGEQREYATSVFCAQRIAPAMKSVGADPAVFRGLLAATARTPANGRTVLLQSVDRSATS